VHGHSSGRRSPGGAFFELVKNRVGTRERAKIFAVPLPDPGGLRIPEPPPAPSPRRQTPVCTVEGIIMPQPIEVHQRSRWYVLKVGGKQRVRIIVAKSGPALAVGQRIQVTGPMVPKVWRDGTHPTLSAHETARIVLPSRG
jgi:hypothetical protein